MFNIDCFGQAGLRAFVIAVFSQYLNCEASPYEPQKQLVIIKDMLNIAVNIYSTVASIQSIAVNKAAENSSVAKSPE